MKYNLSERGRKQLAEWREEEAKRKAEGRPIDKDHRACVSYTEGDCIFLKAYVSWWCGNEDAAEYRGTYIPGVHNCPFCIPRGKGKKAKTPYDDILDIDIPKIKILLLALCMPAVCLIIFYIVVLVYSLL